MGFKRHLLLIPMHFLRAAERINIIQDSLLKDIRYILIRLHLTFRLPHSGVLWAIGISNVQLSPLIGSLTLFYTRSTVFEWLVELVPQRSVHLDFF